MVAKLKNLFLTIVCVVCCVISIKMATDNEAFKWMYILAGIAAIAGIAEFVQFFKSKNDDSEYY